MATKTRKFITEANSSGIRFESIASDAELKRKLTNRQYMDKQGNCNMIAYKINPAVSGKDLAKYLNMAQRNPYSLLMNNCVHYSEQLAQFVKVPQPQNPHSIKALLLSWSSTDSNINTNTKKNTNVNINTWQNANTNANTNISASINASTSSTTNKDEEEVKSLLTKNENETVISNSCLKEEKKDS